MKILSFFVTCLTLIALSLHGATYYVDFAGGDNAADGLTPATAWKHSPGDRNATGNPKAAELQPGDTIRFKGGVQYFGEVQLKAAGTADMPIVLDGNSDGSYGTGPAIFDGAEMIRDWKPVPTADMVGGNPQWKTIMYADLDVDLTSNFSQDTFILHRDGKTDRQAPWQRVFLIDGERRVMPIAQRPKPSDPFYPDLPADFLTSPHKLESTYPHDVYYEEGSRGNRSLPVIAITYGGNPPVVEPFNGGTVSVKMNAPAKIAEFGIRFHRPTTYVAPEQVAFLADGEEVLVADLNQKESAMQRFSLPKPVDASKLSFQLRDSKSDRRWTKVTQIAAYTPDGDNVIERRIASVVRDEERFTQADQDWYDGMFIGVHGGNNHVYFARIDDYDAEANELHVPHFTSTTYNKTNYALYNSPKFIDLPGEWSLEPLDGGKTRVFLLPEELKGGQPVNIGYPVLSTAVTLESSVAHVEIRGFLMQRYSGGGGGVVTRGRGNERPNHIRIADCEVRFMSGQSGISLNHSDFITVENCYIHHCPGWTVGIYVNRVNDYKLLGNRVEKNSGSGIRHYEAKRGILKNNYVLAHYGMHSSGLNFYEGCEDILFEGNYVHNVIAINRAASNLTFRNNIVDSEDRNAVNIAMWQSGRTGGRFIKNLTFENNTLVNLNEGSGWHTSIFVQGGASRPEGLVIRNNVLDKLRVPNPGKITENIFMLETDEKVIGSDYQMVSDENVLFVDPANGDFRRKPGGPMMKAGADVPPPPAVWTR